MNKHLVALLVVPLLGASPTLAPTLSSASEPACGAPGPAIWPVKSTPYGKSYEQWASAWWQWAFSLPPAVNPLLDETGDQCMVGQQGPVWNLAGVPGTGEVSRQCDVPCDRALLFPFFNAFNINVFPPPYASDQELQQALVGFIDQVVSSVAAELDGVPLPGSAMRRIRPHFFSYTLPEENLLLPFFGLDVPAGVYSPAVGDGYYMMLSPLAPGPHTLHFTANGDFGGGPQVIQDVTYELNVVAPPSIPVPQ